MLFRMIRGDRSVAAALVGAVLMFCEAAYSCLSCSVLDKNIIGQAIDGFTIAESL